MTRDETVALFLACEAKRKEARVAALAAGVSEFDTRFKISEAGKAHWNAWAEAMLAQRKQLEVSHLWVLGQSTSGDFEPKNAETRAWISAARADFSRCHFVVMERQGEVALQESRMKAIPVARVVIGSPGVDMRGLIFPGEVRFDNAVFDQDADFVGAVFVGRAQFDSVTFNCDASFVGAHFGEASFGYNAIFKGHASFSSSTVEVSAHFYGAVFEGDASFGWAKLCRATFNDVAFRGNAFFGYTKFVGGQAAFFGATFAGEASYSGTTFEKHAGFDAATFSKVASFGGATFRSEATFSDASFLDWADFQKVSFLGHVSFENATFSRSTSFRDSNFGAEEKKTAADFTAIKVERAFDLTGALFSKVPSFCQADFKQAPDLDRVRFPLPSAEPMASGDKVLIPKYRALRRMAIQGADYEAEHKAFKGELRSRRWIEDTWRHPSLWLGMLYDLAADCGRSVGRPFAIWLASILAFAVLYIPSAKHGWDACAGGGGAMFWNALYISGRNAFVISSVGKGETAAQAYECLFGAKTAPLGVSGVETFVQAPLSAVLIFLFLLAVKNRFKIK
jgi:hypothetical protein